ncbi:hypothetical protein KJ765_02855 [Candidatus Micrarchaeota archaeon]|nr:hypothetical protein [Candidatus Micrarchaeota archaeon]
MKRKTVLVFGNPLVENDALALKIMPALQKEFPEIEFKEFDTAEDLEKEGRTLLILDVVEGLETAKCISNFEQLHTQTVYSLHDFDLGVTLKLLKKLEILDAFTVFGLPMNARPDDALKQVIPLIKSSLLSESETRN